MSRRTPKMRKMKQSWLHFRVLKPKFMWSWWIILIVFWTAYMIVRNCLRVSMYVLYINMHSTRKAWKHTHTQTHTHTVYTHIHVWLHTFTRIITHPFTIHRTFAFISAGMQKDRMRTLISTRQNGQKYRRWICDWTEQAANPKNIHPCDDCASPRPHFNIFASALGDSPKGGLKTRMARIENLDRWIDG